MSDLIVVTVEWDPEGRVWIAQSDDVPGLVTGADTIEQLIEKLKIAVPEMLAENGVSFDAGLQFKVETRVAA